MAGSMERLYELPPRIIHELDEELPVGVLGLDNWGYVTMGPDRNPDSMPSDGWGLYHPPEYYYYMDPPSATTTPATTYRYLDRQDLYILVQLTFLVSLFIYAQKILRPGP